LLLRLADGGRRAHIAREMMRTSLSLFAALLVVTLASCQSVPDRKAGGGAFDDSYLAQRLDSNHPTLRNDDAPSAESYEQWREQE